MTATSSRPSPVDHTRVARDIPIASRRALQRRNDLARILDLGVVVGNDHAWCVVLANLAPFMFALRGEHRIHDRARSKDAADFWKFARRIEFLAGDLGLNLDPREVRCAAEALVREVDEKGADFALMPADRVATLLGVDTATREAARAWTIGATDEAAEDRRRRRWREADARRRAREGAVSRSQSITAAKPWVDAGVSRATWYRRLRETKNSYALPIDKGERRNLSHTPPPAPDLASSMRTALARVRALASAARPALDRFDHTVDRLVASIAFAREAGAHTAPSDAGSHRRGGTG
jgi:hypothetical protein